MKSLVFATNNRHKLDEIREIFRGIAEISGLEETGFNGEIPEDHETLEDNAAQKAFYIYDRIGRDCFADDTGLEIEALEGGPGVYSARYAGPGCNFDDNMNKVLEKMKLSTNRNARFRTVIALVEAGKVKLFEGTVEGKITHGKKGVNGFGYDPIFQPDGYTETFAEMPPGVKNKISHRAIAVNNLLNYLKQSQNV